MSERTLSVLLIDDDLVDRMTVERAVEKMDSVTLVTAANGLDALQKLRSRGVPRDRLVILLDLNMPRMNGLEFLRELRLDPMWKRTPVIVLTSSDEERDRLAAYDSNVAGYIVKPITSDRFAEAMGVLRNYLDLVEFP